MKDESPQVEDRKGQNERSLFGRSLTVWVALCLAGGIALGKVAPGVATFLDGLSLHAGAALVVSIPIAICAALRFSFAGSCFAACRGGSRFAAYRATSARE